MINCAKKILQVILCLLVFIYSIQSLQAQISINTDNSDPDASAMLDIKSTDKGILVPRMTTAQRGLISSPAIGLLVFDTDTETFWFNETSGWVELRSGNVDELADGDGDTKIQVDEGGMDDDVIRFDVGGTEHITVKDNGNGHPMIEFPGSNSVGNVSIGSNAGSSLLAHSKYNVLIGQGAGRDLASEGSNTFIGRNSGTEVTSGRYNTYLGASSGRENLIGNSNVFLGNEAGQSSDGGGNVFIGNQAGKTMTGSNHLVIDNYDNPNPLIYGHFNSDLLRINGTLNINNAFSFPTTDGTTNQVLKTDGAGTLTWHTPFDSPFTHNSTDKRVEPNTALVDVINDDFVFGSTQLDDTGNSDHDNRFFFDKSKAAFRAGEANDDEWDEANIGAASVAIGEQNKASGESSVAFGEDNESSGKASVAMGDDNIASGETATAIGNSNDATANFTTAIGAGNIANSLESVAVGVGNEASATNATAVGIGTKATDVGASAFGEIAEANGVSSTALGSGAIANGDQSTAIGYDAQANGLAAYAIGDNTRATGDGSLALGTETTASGDFSTAIGQFTTAYSAFETVLGSHNTSYTPNSTSGWNINDRLLTVGNGAAPIAPSDALVVYKNGNTTIKGLLTLDNDFPFIDGITFPNIDGNANQVLKTNGSGILGWEDDLGGTLIEDGDSDTKIQVDEGSMDEDIIRFDIAGTEYLNLDGKRINIENTGGSIYVGENAGENDDFSNNHNIGIGYGALFSEQLGVYNVGLGYESLYGSEEGEYNVASGYQAMRNNEDGSYNVASGYQALYDNNDGGHNVALGYQPLHNNQTGGTNIAISDYALFSNINGHENIALGYEALTFNTNGDYNIAHGNQALYANTTGDNNIALGYQALKANGTGSDNIAIGKNADVGAGNLTNATAIGANATVSQSNALVLGNNANVGIGTSTPDEKLHVVGNVKIVDGNQANGYVLTSDANGVGSWQSVSASLTGDAIEDADGDTKIQVDEGGMDDDIIRFDLGGTEYLRMNAGRLEFANTGGSIFIGEDIGLSDDYMSNYNIGLGYQSLFSNTNGTGNIAHGYQVLYSNIGGSNNIASGYRTMQSNTSGSSNIALGYYTLNSNTTGNENVAIGKEALRINQTGGFNVAIGYNANLLNTTGFGNTSNGSYALSQNTTGSYNVGLGYNALISNKIGTNNTAIGSGANVSTDGLTNATAIGWNAIVGQSNSLVLGNNADVGIGTSTPDEKLHVVGNIKMVDGNQASGYVLTSDANGVGTWQAAIGGSTDSFEDTDGDTKIQVEESADEDVIRFDVAGTEEMVIENGRINFPNSGNNIFIGDEAGKADDFTNNSNIAIGNSSFGTNITGVSNTIVGNGADVGSSNLTNATALGAFATVSQSNALILGNNADVGIGTSTPDEKLHVVGNIKMVDGNQTNGYVLTSDANGVGSWQAFVVDSTSISDDDGDTKIQVDKGSADEDMIRFDIAGTEKMIIDADGKVGIGTSSPDEELHVVGSIKMVDGAEGAGKVLTSDADGVGSWQTLNTSDNQTIDTLQLNGTSLEISLEGDGEAAKKLDLSSFAPIGSIQMWPTQTPPTGWLICDGQSITQANYPDLYTVLGGSGGSTSIPNFTGKFPLGEKFPVNQGETPYQLNTTGGEEEVTLTIAEMPAHSHGVTITYREGQEGGSGNDYSDLGGGTGNSTSYTSDSVGGGGAHNNMPPFYVVHFIIKAE